MTLVAKLDCHFSAEAHPPAEIAIKAAAKSLRLLVVTRVLDLLDVIAKSLWLAVFVGKLCVVERFGLNISEKLPI